MSLTENYCLLTGGRCSHYPINVEMNTFFISEPYDKKRQEREASILEAIKGYKHVIADHKAMNIALTCKICQQIQSAQFGIVDITSGNRNVLIELGMLYGFNKPVVILIKRSEKTKIEIPSNIIGIEQIRYENFYDLTQKLKSILATLFDLWKNRTQYFLDLRPAIESQIEQLGLAIETRRLLTVNIEGTILGLKFIDNVAIIIIDKGTEHGIKKDMIFKVLSYDKKVGEQYLEEENGFLIVMHPQEKISQCQPISIDPNKQFWKDLFEKTVPSRNIVRPYLADELMKMTEDEMKEWLSKLKILREGYTVMTRGT
jgi:hypothetical protein